jgi:alpha-mannosidase
VKQAEESGDVVVRLHECMNRRTRTRLRCLWKIEQAEECDLEERMILGTILPEGDSFAFEILPYEIKTFRIHFAKK